MKEHVKIRRDGSPYDGRGGVIVQHTRCHIVIQSGRDRIVCTHRDIAPASSQST